MKYVIVDEKAGVRLRKKAKTVAAFAAAGALAFGVGAGSTLEGSTGYGPILDWTEKAYAAHDGGKEQGAGKIRVNITVGDHGSVDEKTENFFREVSSGGACTLAIQADDGYVIGTLKVNGEDLAEEERKAFIGKAKKELILELLTEDTSVEVGFIPKPSEGETRYQVTTEAGAGGSITESFDYFGGTEDNTVFWEAGDGYVVDRVILDGEVLADETGKVKGTRSFTTGDHTLKVTFVESRQAVKGEAVRSTKNATSESTADIGLPDAVGADPVEDEDPDTEDDGSVNTSLPDTADDQSFEEEGTEPEDDEGAGTSLPETVDDESAQYEDPDTEDDGSGDTSLPDEGRKSDDTSMPESASQSGDPDEPAATEDNSLSDNTGQPDAKTEGVSDDPSSPSYPETAQTGTHHSETRESPVSDGETAATEKSSGSSAGYEPKTGDSFPRTGAGLMIMSALLIRTLTGRRRT